MDKAEREALAVDIARRVRLLCVQDVPKSAMDVLQDGYQRFNVYTKAARDCAYVQIEKRCGALHIEWWINDNRVMHLRLDEDPSR